MGDVGCMTASEIVEKLRERVMKSICASLKPSRTR